MSSEAPKSTVIAEIQCIPSPAGTPEVPYAHVHDAIEVIRRSGLAYEVGPVGTSIEGEPDQVWPLLRKVHETCLAAGATKCISVVKVFEQTDDDPATMASLTDRYRDQ